VKDWYQKQKNSMFFLENCGKTDSSALKGCNVITIKCEMQGYYCTVGLLQT